MGKYLFRPDNRVISDDLKQLPLELRDLFFSDIKKSLNDNPEKPKKFSNHDLFGKLSGYLALEIPWADDPNAYRLVYKIIDSPAPRYVKIISFAKHDPAYKLATLRVEEDKAKKKRKKRKR